MEKLSARYSFPSLWKIEQEKGSIIRGQIGAAKERKAKGHTRSKIISFRNGLQVLIDALVAGLPEGVLRLGTPVSEVRREAGSWLVCTGADALPAPERFDAVLLALPAHALAPLLIEGERPASSLAEIVHPPVTSLFLGYKRTQIAHPLDGFGVLIPEIEKRRELGVLFSSSLFPGRAPEGHVGLTVMVGGMRQPEIARLSPDEILATVEPDLRDLLGVEGKPVFQRCTAWAAAIPQYNLGYGPYLELFGSLEARYPGLHFGGNARDGISVPNCILSGRNLAASLDSDI